MKITFDTEQVHNSGISIPEFLVCLSYYLQNPISTITLQRVENGGQYAIFGLLSEEGERIVENLLIQEKETQSDKDRFEELADKLRALYPSGKKEGTAYMWKDSTKVIAKKLKTLAIKYNADFTDEQAINATKRYVESFNGNYLYMQLLKYFILKRVNKEGEIEETSQLLSYIENEGQSDINNDWVNEVV